MRRRYRRFRLGKLLSAALVLALTGCGGTRWSDVQRSLPPVPTDKARVIFFRPSHFAGGSVKLYVSINDIAVGRLTNGSVLRVDHAPGTLAIKIEPAAPLGLLALDHWLNPDYKLAETLSAQGGKTYYLEIGEEKLSCDPGDIRPGVFATCTALSAPLTGGDRCKAGWCISIRDEGTALPKLAGLTVETAKGE